MANFMSSGPDTQDASVPARALKEAVISIHLAAASPSMAASRFSAEAMRLLSTRHCLDSCSSSRSLPLDFTHFAEVLSKASDSLASAELRRSSASKALRPCCSSPSKASTSKRLGSSPAGSFGGVEGSSTPPSSLQSLLGPFDSDEPKPFTMLSFTTWPSDKAKRKAETFWPRIASSIFVCTSRTHFLHKTSMASRSRDSSIF
mmetsp:Transcript_69911/g.154175  ORF Transcript_69911/g.154175 Transcript_69911/m.154175 type:complete len:203 (+) Transcript_69911:1152-1760(+)